MCLGLCLGLGCGSQTGVSVAPGESGGPDPALARAPEPEPEPDGDGDGFRDSTDACPEQAGIAPAGCPLLDSDGDGPLDPDDACPHACETYNGFADADGCPDDIPDALLQILGPIEGLTFETDRPAVASSSHVALDAIAQTLLAYPEVEIAIEGHRDDHSEPVDSRRLVTRDRAESVMQYLVAAGVARDRLEAVGYGETRPIASNKNADGRAQNRRVELVLKVTHDSRAKVCQAAPVP